MPTISYSIRHITKFKYSAPISENVMDVRMQPRTDEHQQSLDFYLYVQPNTKVFIYQDSLNNTIHHFSIPGLHKELSLKAEAVVNVSAPEPLPAALTEADWAAVDGLSASVEHWDMCTPSPFTQFSPILQSLAEELNVSRRADPLTVLRELNEAIHRTFTYSTEATNVDSPIDEAIVQRRGVCQDYAHVMLALVRNFLHMPGRYVSGYLYHRQSDQSVSAATHAWVEIFLPQLGWVGFDPTNNLIAGERHIRAAIGRDYHEVPPTRGIFKGNADSELSVSVRVRRSDDPVANEESTENFISQLPPGLNSYTSSLEMASLELAQQQQQQ